MQLKFVVSLVILLLMLERTFATPSSIPVCLFKARVADVVETSVVVESMGPDPVRYFSIRLTDIKVQPDEKTRGLRCDWDNISNESTTYALWPSPVGAAPIHAGDQLEVATTETNTHSTPERPLFLMIGDGGIVGDVGHHRPADAALLWTAFALALTGLALRFVPRRRKKQ